MKLVIQLVNMAVGEYTLYPWWTFGMFAYEPYDAHRVTMLARPKPWDFHRHPCCHHGRPWSPSLSTSLNRMKFAFLFGRKCDKRLKQPRSPELFGQHFFQQNPTIQGTLGMWTRGTPRQVDSISADDVHQLGRLPAWLKGGHRGCGLRNVGVATSATVVCSHTACN